MDEGVEVVAGELGGGHGHGGQGGRGATWWVGGPLGIHSDLQETSSYLLSATLQPASPAVTQRVEVVESLAAGVAELGACARVHVVVPQ